MSSTQEAGDIFGEGSGPAQAMLRSPTVLIASIGLWGMNVYFFRLFKIDYVYVLNLDLVKEREAQSRTAPPSGNAIRRLTDIEDGDDNISSKRSDASDDDDDDSQGKKETTNGDQAPGNAITWDKLVILSVSLLFLLHLTIYIWIDFFGGGSIGAVFCFYGAVTTAIVFPLSSTRWLRSATVIVLQRLFELVNPRCSCVSPDAKGPRPIPFIDVFFADAMCSLSKVFFDWGMLWHLAAHYPYPVPKSSHSILIPSFCAAIPYFIRARQCLIMHTVGRVKRDPKRYQHLLNALKYTTSIFPLCLSAYQQTIDPEKAQRFEGFLIVLLTINALYALAWDIVMDWGMMQNPTAVLDHACVGGGVASDELKAPTCCHAVLRPRLRFGLLMSTVILVADAVLRFSWMLRFQDSILTSKDHFVLVTQFLEIFRRAIWNLLRVEWENLKQSNERKKSLNFKPKDTVPFLVAPSSLSMASLHKA